MLIVYVFYLFCYSFLSCSCPVCLSEFFFFAVTCSDSFLIFFCSSFIAIFFCDYHGDYIHILGITIPFKLIMSIIYKTLFLYTLPSQFVIDVTIISLYILYPSTYFFSFLILFVKFYTKIKICTPPLQYYKILYISIYLPLSKNFTFLCALALLSGVPFFQLEELPLAKLVRKPSLAVMNFLSFCIWEGLYFFFLSTFFVCLTFSLIKCSDKTKMNLRNFQIKTK